MTDKSFDFESGSQGTQLSTSNSPYSSSSVFGGCIFDSASAVHGQYGLSVQASSGSAAFVDFSGGGTTNRRKRFSYICRTISTSTQIYQSRTSGGQSSGIVHNSASNVLNIVDAAGTGRANSPAMTVGHEYQIFIETHSDASAGTIGWAVYDASNNSLFGSGSLSALNTRGGDITNDRIGKITANAVTSKLSFDDDRADDSTLTRLPLVAVSTLPISNAGADQVNGEPGSVATLDFSGSSTPSGSTITAYNLTQTGGATVTVDSSNPVHPKFTIPASMTPATYTFSLTVTNSLGQTSSADTVSVSALGNTDAVAQSGALVGATRYRIV